MVMTQAAPNETSHPRILVVDDDRSMRHALTRYLSLDHYDVFEASNSKEAMAIVVAESPDLVLLDLMLGDEDGLAVLEQIRSISSIPVILLTGKTEEADRVTGLKLGADDYVVKPFSSAEVVARVASVLRRTMAPDAAPVLTFDNLVMNLRTRQVALDGNTVRLTAKEFDLLAFLAASPKQVFSRQQLLDRVWNSSSAWQSADTVTEHIRRLRKRIELAPAAHRWLLTVWGVGYRFNP